MLLLLNDRSLPPLCSHPFLSSPVAFTTVSSSAALPALLCMQFGELFELRSMVAPSVRQRLSDAQRCSSLSRNCNFAGSSGQQLVGIFKLIVFTRVTPILLPTQNIEMRVHSLALL